MTPERWQRINEILEAVDSAPQAGRADVLDRLCEGDPGLRRDVESYLVDTGEGTFLHGVIGEQAASFSQPESRQERFGRYKLVRRIGQGGMGAVFEAIRVDDFHKKVALKIIKQGLDSDFARTRFLQERQTLAGLEHPYIARLLDGGETDDGSPFLVLEFVDGQPITDYCAKLDRTARLHLFLKVCEAVEHAHRNLVVHRDLKPANILVTATGEPKLLDFGIAKLLDPGSSQTQTGFAALTPDYASPEQVRGEPITTASDVYSLGVILYQLLTGRKPYALDTATLLEMDRIVCQLPPAPPGLGDELDHILLMALRKEPDRRYAGVQRFAEDIERYLDHRPVSARADTIRYRAQKFVRRNWWQIAGVATVILSLGVGLGFSVIEQRRANRRFNEVRQLANQFLFEFHDEIANTPGTVKAREMIVRTALKYLNSLAADASGDSGLQWEMAVAYGKVAAAQGSTQSPSLRRRPDAMASYEKAFALARPLAEHRLLNDQQRAAFVNLLGEAEMMRLSLIEYDAAIRLGREAVDRSAGLPAAVQRGALLRLGTSLGYSGDLLGSLAIEERALPILREAAQRDPSYENRRVLATNLVSLGHFQGRLTRFSEAAATEAEALGRLRALAAERPLNTEMRRRVFNCSYYLALVEGAADRPSEGNFAKGIERFEEALAELGVQIEADAHDNSTRNDAALAHIQLALAHMESAPGKALQHALLAAKILDAASPDNKATRAEARIAAADALRNLRHFAQAESLLKEAEAVMAVRGADADLELAWARLKAALGDPAAAALHFTQSIAIAGKSFAKAPTPANAWRLTRVLEFAAVAVPEGAHTRRERILAVWEDQNRRFPGMPYIADKVREAARIAQSPKNIP